MHAQLALRTVAGCAEQIAKGPPGEVQDAYEGNHRPGERGECNPSRTRPRLPCQFARCMYAFVSSGEPLQDMLLRASRSCLLQRFGCAANSPETSHRASSFYPLHGGRRVQTALPSPRVARLPDVLLRVRATPC